MSCAESGIRGLGARQAIQVVSVSLVLVAKLGDDRSVWLRGDATRKDKNHELQQSNKFTSVTSQAFLKQCLVSWPKSIVPFRANYRQADLLQLPKGFETRDVSGATQQARGASEAARQCGKNLGGPRWRVNS